MKIEQLAAKPTLIQITLDDAKLVETYGDVITFYSYDIVSMNTYFEFFNARSNSEFENLDKLIRRLILREDGSPVLRDGEDLPIDIMAAAISKVGEMLGKSPGKTSTSTVGEELT